MKRKGTVQTFSIDKMQLASELILIQDLMPIDSYDRNNLKEDIKKHGIREPIKGYVKNGIFFILAGANRFEIATELGLREVPVEIMDKLPKKEREQFCIDDNLNRRHLTRQQKRKLIERELLTHPHLSDRQIAQKTQASPTTVGTQRKSLEQLSKLDTLTERKGKDGKTRKTPEKIEASVKTTNPGKKMNEPELIDLVETLQQQYAIAGDGLKARFRNTFKEIMYEDDTTALTLKRAAFIEKHRNTKQNKKTRNNAVDELCHVIDALMESATDRQKKNYREKIQKALETYE